MTENPYANKSGGIATPTPPTWCPGCPNYQIYTGIREVIEEGIKKKKWKKNDFAMVSGVGCHGKIYDYTDLNGLNTLHGRVPPTCLGLKLGNPKLKVLGFSGDGDAYSEGLAHTIQAARYNSNWTYIIHNNQIFALTVGQPTPMTEQGFKDKTTPHGVFLHPLNPIATMLINGATFVARVFADHKQVADVYREALKHNGFAFIEILQPCIIFHDHSKYKEHTYNLQDKDHDTSDFKKALREAQVFDYNTITKIPTGIFYKTKRPTFEEQVPAVKKLITTKKSWRDIPR